MKNWLKITLSIHPLLVEAAADFLVGIVGAAVEIGVDDDLENKTLNSFVEKESPNSQEIERVISQVKEYLHEIAKIFKVMPPQMSWMIIEDEDWGRNWKKHFSPFAIVPRLVIAPTWEKYRAGKNEKVIVMDPGMAFGTGHHATTALVLQFIVEVMNRRKGADSVLDVGTGTGILAMAAALMGAEKVVAIDNDADAVMAAAENVKGNNLSTIIEVSDTQLSDIDDTFSLVVANIIYDALLQMAADLQRVTAIDGLLVVSGILHDEQVEGITTAFTKVGFQLEEDARREEWAALLFLRAV